MKLSMLVRVRSIWVIRDGNEVEYEEIIWVTIDGVVWSFVGQSMKKLFA